MIELRKGVRFGRGFKGQPTLQEFKDSMDLMRAIKAKYTQAELIGLGYAKATVYNWYQRSTLPNAFYTVKLKKLLGEIDDCP